MFGSREGCERFLAEMIRRNAAHSEDISADEERFDCSVFPGAEFDLPRR
jgi:hypothetical protein